MTYLNIEFGYFFTMSHGITGRAAPTRKKNVSAEGKGRSSNNFSDTISLFLQRLTVKELALGELQGGTDHTPDDGRSTEYFCRRANESGISRNDSQYVFSAKVWGMKKRQ